MPSGASLYGLTGAKLPDAHEALYVARQEHAKENLLPQSTANIAFTTSLWEIIPACYIHTCIFEGSDFMLVENAKPSGD
jgi:hypothetical protein